MQLITLEKKRTTNPILEEQEIELVSSLVGESLKRSRFEIEIGSGNGHFLARYAGQHPGSFMLGVEARKERCVKTKKKLVNAQISNAEILYSRAEELIYHLPQGSVDDFHIYFPDPWPKYKHKKRRFFRMSNLDSLFRCLKPGGRIFFASDIFDYYLQAKVLFILHHGFRLVEAPPAGLMDEIRNSLFAGRFIELEKKIYFTAAVKS